MKLKAGAALVSVQPVLVSFNGGHFHKIVQAIYTSAATIEHNNSSTIVQ